jgi:hypothetical protein
LFTNYNGHRYLFLGEILLSKGGGRKAFSRAPNNALDLLELRKERKKTRIPRIQRIDMSRIIF